MPGLPILKIDNLSVEFSSDGEIIKAVDNISFELNKGEILGIVGESGSGKSVTALSVLRLISCSPGKISSGEIIFQKQNGEKTDLLKLPEKEMQKIRGNEISMIFQEPMTSLNPVKKCGKQVTEAILQHQKISKKEAKQKAISFFEQVLLPRPENIFNSYPFEISGGQKQRVMIAMALSCNPQILIADEPTTAIDVTVQKTILELLKNLQKDLNLSIIFITHDLAVVSEIAQKILVMFKGKIVEQGNTKEIFGSPEHPYTKSLLACRPPLNKPLSKLPVISDFLEINNNGEIKSKNSTIENILNEYSLNIEERKALQNKLYSKEPILQIKNLKTYFPVNEGIIFKSKNLIKAVDDISFDVYKGETLGLVGESGCGKTTLGRTILRLIESTSGQIIYKGKDLTMLSNKEMKALRKNIQIIFQDPYSSLNPRITIGSAIEEPMKVFGILNNFKERKNRTIEILEKVGLNESHFNRYPHEFSGGQRQRICIARALALNPEFLICDESVSALDVSVQAQVLNLFNDLKKDFGFTYIFISHDLSVVKFMSDRLIVMNNGKIEEINFAEEVYKNPKSDYTKKLINSIPKIEI
ncbi:MAG: ABC transporter ATP-binding protein [Bacteroidales bacterium]|nr:ABC transporter ATP-binding protein [Bacteroidales bacterium]